MIKKICFKRGLLLTAFLFAPLVQAKIHIEPYAGWSFVFTSSNPLKKESLSQTTKTIDYLRQGRYYQGPTPGMRLGYSSLGLAVGLDVNVGYWSSLWKEDWTSFRGEETIAPVLPGLFVSYKLPLLFRAYATLIPFTTVKVYTKADSKWCNQSQGAKFGISYLSLPFISVNLEYMPLYIGGTACQTWSHIGTAYANFTF